MKYARILSFLFLSAGALLTPSTIGFAAGKPTAAQPIPPFSAPWLSFNTALSASTGSPIALATGDVDGDSDLDVVAARAYAAGGFVLLRNDGAGRLAAPESYPGTGRAAGIVMADLNGDGRLDVAVTDSDALTTGNTVSVFLGNGTGTFGARQAFSVGTGNVVPVGIAAADFDSDGDVDLAVAAYGFNAGGSTIVLLRNNGNGSFAAPLSFSVGSGPYDLTAGDLTGDGRPDLAVAHRNYRVTVLANNGSGGFGPAVPYDNLGANYAGPLFPSVALGDVDRDGDLDVLYGNTRTWDGTAGHIVQLRNTGTGTLSRAADIPLTTYSAGPADIVAADLNGDGAPDLLAASYSGRSDDGVYVIQNDGAGGFGAAVLYPAGQITAAVAAADLNGDGRSDVLTADSYSNAITVRLNDGSGAFPIASEDFAAFIQTFQDAADIDGDGDLDLFTSGPHPSASEGTILRNDGHGRFPNRTAINNGIDGVSAGVLRDLNGDGRPDLLFNNANTSSQYDFFTAMNNGDGTFAAPRRWVVRSAGWGEIDAFDLDGDGDLDVVDMEAEGAPGIPDGRFFIAMNNGDGTFQTPYSYDLLPHRPEDVVAGDFNEDGHLDLAMTNHGAYGFDTSVFIVRGHGDGTFDPPIVYTVGRGPLYLLTADFDADGHLDLATVNSGYNNEGAESVTLLFGTGTGTFNRISTQYAPYSPDLLGATGIATGDVDGDGDLDLMTTGVSNDVALYLNNGMGTFAFPYRLGAVAGAHFPLLKDFTGDGVLDLAILSARPALGFDSGVAVLSGDDAIVRPSSAASRKSHGPAGAFDIDLPLTGNTGIECRSGGTNGDYQLIVTFPNPVTLNGAQVTSGVGSVSSFSVSGDGRQVTVNLTGIANEQRIAVTLVGVSDGSHANDVVLQMGVLVGDTNANGIVNSSDISQTKSRSGQTATSSNFRSDVTVNGAINASDLALVKTQSGTGLP